MQFLLGFTTGLTCVGFFFLGMYLGWRMCHDVNNGGTLTGRMRKAQEPILRDDQDEAELEEALKAGYKGATR